MPGERTAVKLNKKQQRLLILLYRFRYATLPLLKNYLELKSHSLQYNFNILEHAEFIIREYDELSRIERRPAVYYLSKQGIRYLKQNNLIPAQNLHVLYKNPVLSHGAKQHFLDVMSLYIYFRKTNTTSFEYFTKTEIAKADYFPSHKPDLYLRSLTNTRDYFVILISDSLSYIFERRLSELVNHSEEEGWLSGEYPGLLFVLSNEAHEKRFRSIASNMLESAGISYGELPIATVSRSLLHTENIKSPWLFLGADLRSGLS